MSWPGFVVEKSMEGLRGRADAEYCEMLLLARNHRRGLEDGGSGCGERFDLQFDHVFGISAPNSSGPTACSLASGYFVLSTVAV